MTQAEEEQLEQDLKAFPRDPAGLGRLRRAYMRAIRNGLARFECDGREYEVRYARYMLERVSEPERNKMHGPGRP